MKGIGDFRLEVVKAEPSSVRVGKFASTIRTGSSFQVLDGSSYRVVSHIEGAGETYFKLASRDGKVISASKTEVIAMVPLSPNMARTASFLRWAVNENVDAIIKEAIRHAGLPVDESMNWSRWFSRTYNSKMNTKDPSLIEDAIQEIILKYLYTGNYLQKNIDYKRLNQSKNQAEQITQYLSTLFANKRSEAEKYIEKVTGTERKQRNVKDEQGERVQEKNPSGQLLFWTGEGIGRQKTIQKTDYPVYVKEKVEDAPHLESENREGEEGEYSLFDATESNQATEAFNAIVKDDDLRKLRTTFFDYVKNTLEQRDKTAASALLAFDLAIESEEGRPSDWVEEWTERTGLSPSSQKVTLKKLGDWLVQFVKDHPEFENSHTFIKLIVQMMRKEEKQVESKATHASLMASLKLADFEDTESADGVKVVAVENATNEPPTIVADAEDEIEYAPQEGDIVGVDERVGGGFGKVVEMAPSGKFAIVEDLSNGEVSSYHNSDLHKLSDEEIETLEEAMGSNDGLDDDSDFEEITTAASDEEVQQRFLKDKSNRAEGKGRAAVRKRLEGIFDKVGWSAKGQCFVVKQGYFYTHGNDEQKVAAKLQRAIPEAIIVDASNHWNAWPRDSWFEVRFKMPSQGADASQPDPGAAAPAGDLEQKSQSPDSDTRSKEGSMKTAAKCKYCEHHVDHAESLERGCCDSCAKNRKERGMEPFAKSAAGTRSHHYFHDAEYVVFQVLNGGFQQLWDNAGRREENHVPSMIKRTGKFFEENGKPEAAAIFNEVARMDNREIDDEGADTNYDQPWDALESKFYDLWHSDPQLEALFPDEESEAPKSDVTPVNPAQATASSDDTDGTEDWNEKGRREEEQRERKERNKEAAGETALTIRVPHTALLPDNAAWTNRMQIKSESSDRMYTVAQSKSGGWWGCNCMGWIRHKNCKHLRELGLPGNQQPQQAVLQKTNTRFANSKEDSMKLAASAKVNQSKKAAKASSADYTKFRSIVASQPQEVQAAIEEFRDTFAMMASKTDAMLKNLGLKAAAENAPLKEKIASKRAFAAGLKKLADGAPGQFAEALGQMYQQLDDVADGIEAMAENLGIELPAVSPEPLGIEDPMAIDAPPVDAGLDAPPADMDMSAPAPEGGPEALPADPNAVPAIV